MVEAASVPYATLGNTLTNSFKGIADAIDGYQKLKTELNTQHYLDQLDAYADPNKLEEARQNGALQALRQSYGRYFDRAGTREADESRLKSLQEIAKSNQAYNDFQTDVAQRDDVNEGIAMIAKGASLNDVANYVQAKKLRDAQALIDFFHNNREHNDKSLLTRSQADTYQANAANTRASTAGTLLQNAIKQHEFAKQKTAEEQESLINEIRLLTAFGKNDKAAELIRANPGLIGISGVIEDISKSIDNSYKRKANSIKNASDELSLTKDQYGFSKQVQRDITQAQNLPAKNQSLVYAAKGNLQGAWDTIAGIAGENVGPLVKAVQEVTQGNLSNMGSAEDVQAKKLQNNATEENAKVKAETAQLRAKLVEQDILSKSNQEDINLTVNEAMDKGQILPDNVVYTPDNKNIDLPATYTKLRSIINSNQPINSYTLTDEDRKEVKNQADNLYVDMATGRKPLPDTEDFRGKSFFDIQRSSVLAKKLEEHVNKSVTQEYTNNRITSENNARNLTLTSARKQLDNLQQLIGNHGLDLSTDSDRATKVVAQAIADKKSPEAINSTWETIRQIGENFGKLRIGNDARNAKDAATVQDYADNQELVNNWMASESTLSYDTKVDNINKELRARFADDLDKANDSIIVFNKLYKEGYKPEGAKTPIYLPYSYMMDLARRFDTDYFEGAEEEILEQIEADLKERPELIKQFQAVHARAADAHRRLNSKPK